MPRKGYKAITIREELFQKLEALSTKTHRSIGQYIEYILENSSEEVTCH